MAACDGGIRRDDDDNDCLEAFTFCCLLSLMLTTSTWNIFIQHNFTFFVHLLWYSLSHVRGLHWYSLSRPGVGDPEIKGMKRRFFVSLNYLRVNLNMKLKVSGTNVWWVGSMVGGL